MNLKPAIVEDGQDYVDRAATAGQDANVLIINPRPAAAAVGALFGSRAPAPITVVFIRERLRWMTLGQNGDLLPRPATTTAA